MTHLEQAEKQFAAARGILDAMTPRLEYDLKLAHEHTELGNAYLRLAELYLHYHLPEPEQPKPEPAPRYPQKKGFADGVRPVDTPQPRKP